MTTRLAVVGLGWWGSVLADGIEAAGDAELVSCYARTAESRQAFAAERNIRGAESYEALLSDDEVDAVLLSTTHSSHAELIEAAADAGKHVFCEKPFVLDVEEGKRAMAATERAGVVLQIGHNKRRQPANRRLKQLIDGGDLGTVVLIETHHTSANSLRYTDTTWRNNRHESPLGSMTSLGVHMLDTMHYLMGPVEQVFAFSNRLLDAPVIDHVTTLSVEFECGALGTLGTSFVVPPEVSVTVRGTGGSAWNEDDGGFLWRQAVDSRERTNEPVEVLDTVADQIAEFVRAVEGGPPPETGGAEGLEVIAVLAAAQESTRSGRAEKVADFR